MPVPRKTKWGAVNVLLHWAIYGLLLIQTVTGFLLYLGHGGWWVTVHSFTATTVLIYIVAHSISHFCYGGLQQLLRLFRPSALVRTKATRSRPFLIAASVGSVVAASLVLADYGTLDELQIRTIPASEAPKLDGVMDEAMWKTARPVPCAPCRAPASAASAKSRVEVRAVHDDKKIYFAFRWEDPTPLAAAPAADQEGRRLAHRRRQPVHGRRRRRSTRTSSRSSSRPPTASATAASTHLGREAARRQAGAAERARLSLHHRRPHGRHVAVEGLARRPARRRRRHVHRPRRRSRPSCEARWPGALSGRLLGRSRATPSYTYNFKL